MPWFSVSLATRRPAAQTHWRTSSLKVSSNISVCAHIPALTCCLLSQVLIIVYVIANRPEIHNGTVMLVWTQKQLKAPKVYRLLSIRLLCCSTLICSDADFLRCVYTVGCGDRQETSCFASDHYCFTAGCVLLGCILYMRGAILTHANDDCNSARKGTAELAKPGCLGKVKAFLCHWQMSCISEQCLLPFCSVVRTTGNQRGEDEKHA